MNVEIINVGTELLLGEIVNTNATYIQKMCKDLGFNVYYQKSCRTKLQIHIETLFNLIFIALNGA